MQTYLYLTSVGCLGVLIMFYVKSRGIIFVKNGPQCKNYMGGAWGKFNDQTEPIVLSQLSSNPYQGTYMYQMQKQSVLFQFQSKM